MDAKNWLWPALLFLAGLALAIPLLPTAVSFEDSGEFTAAAATLGIPHPSGYPLYVILAHPFTWLPIGTIPWRVALFSALAASAALAVMFLTARRLAALMGGKLAPRHEALIGLVLLQFAVSGTWWSQAVSAEVYVLHVLLLAIVSYLLLRWHEGGEFRWLAWACFCFGLSLSNHLFLTAAAAPFFFLAIAVAGRKIGPPIRVAGLAGAMAAGLVPYVLIPLRAGAPSAYVFGHLSGFGDILGHIFRRSYADIGIGGTGRPFIAGSVAGQYFHEFGILALLLAGYALWRMRTRLSPIIVWFGGVVLSLAVIIVFLRTGWSEEVGYVFRVFALPGMSVVTIAASVGAYLVLVRGEASSKVAAVVLYVCVAVVPVVSAFSSAPRVAAYSEGYAERYGREVLRTLPENAVLVVSDEGMVQDTELFVLAYLQMVELVRKDVAVVSDVILTPVVRPALPPGHGAFPLEMRRRILLETVLGDPVYADRPVFTTYAPESAVPGIRSRTNGLVYAVARLGEEPLPPASATLVEPSDEIVAGQFALRSLVTHVLYGRAARLVAEGGNKAALAPLLKAIALDPFPASTDYRAFVVHRQSVMLE